MPEVSKVNKAGPPPPFQWPTLYSECMCLRHTFSCVSIGSTHLTAIFNNLGPSTVPKGRGGSCDGKLWDSIKLSKKKLLNSPFFFFKFDSFIILHNYFSAESSPWCHKIQSLVLLKCAIKCV